MQYEAETSEETKLFILYIMKNGDEGIKNKIKQMPNILKGNQSSWTRYLNSQPRYRI